VKNEMFEKDLPVVGKLPQELNGAYMWVILMRVEAYYKACYLHIQHLCCCLLHQTSLIILHICPDWREATLSLTPHMHLQAEWKQPLLWPLCILPLVWRIRGAWGCGWTVVARHSSECLMHYLHAPLSAGQVVYAASYSATRMCTPWHI
jgi:hypothetical protein